MLYHKLQQQWESRKYVVVGLDPDISLIPKFLKGKYKSPGRVFFEFNKEIIKHTKKKVLGYKLNSAFYEAHGADGIVALRKTILEIKKDKNSVVILDAKRGDVGNTSNFYFDFAFKYLSADAITLSPYMGLGSSSKFLRKGAIFLCKTSNKESGEFQDLKLGRKQLYLQVAENAEKVWNTNKNIMLVTGGTSPEAIKKVRQVAPNIPLLVPGIGKQGGNLKKVIQNAGHSFVICSSREIIYSGKSVDFAKKAEEKVDELSGEINKLINK